MFYQLLHTSRICPLGCMLRQFRFYLLGDSEIFLYNIVSVPLLLRKINLFAKTFFIYGESFVERKLRLSPYIHIIIYMKSS